LSKPIERGTWLALAAMGVAVFVLANDFSAINVAIPQIEKDFKTDVTTAQWVVNAYALVFGVLIVTGGRLADLFGRRRAFFIGSAIFAVFSALRCRCEEPVLESDDVESRCVICGREAAIRLPQAPTENGRWTRSPSSPWPTSRSGA
jgi:cyanate permease